MQVEKININTGKFQKIQKSVNGRKLLCVYAINTDNARQFDDTKSSGRKMLTTTVIWSCAK